MTIGKLAWYGAVNMEWWSYRLAWWSSNSMAAVWQCGWVVGWFGCVKARQVRASNQPNRHHVGSTIHYKYKSYKAQSWGKVRMDWAHKRPCSAHIALKNHSLSSCCYYPQFLPGPSPYTAKQHHVTNVDMPTNLSQVETICTFVQGKSEFINVIFFTSIIYWQK